MVLSRWPERLVTQNGAYGAISKRKMNWRLLYLGSVEEIQLVSQFGKVILLRARPDNVPVNSNIFGTGINQVLLKLAHLERILPVQNREEAFLIEIIDLIDMNEAIGAKNHSVCINLRSPFRKKAGLQLIQNVFRQM